MTAASPRGEPRHAPQAPMRSQTQTQLRARWFWLACLLLTLSLLAKRLAAPAHLRGR